MRIRKIWPYVFIAVVIVVVIVGVVYLNKVSGFSMWRGLDTGYCDNLCELARMK